jgi:hypothetical protein
MDGIVCDMCGKELLTDEDTRYVVKIQVYAAYDPMELTADDVARDRSNELAELLRQLESMNADELEDQVARCFEFDLCPACQKKYLAEPLPGVKPPPRTPKEPPPVDGGRDSLNQT